MESTTCFFFYQLRPCVFSFLGVPRSLKLEVPNLSLLSVTSEICCRGSVICVLVCSHSITTMDFHKVPSQCLWSRDVSLSRGWSLLNRIQLIIQGSALMKRDTSILRQQMPVSALVSSPTQRAGMCWGRCIEYISLSSTVQIGFNSSN